MANPASTSSIDQQTGRIPPATGYSAEYARIRSFAGPFVFIALHAALALTVVRVQQVAILHAGLVLAVGLWWALTKPVEQVAYVGAYIAGAEVFWRMNGVDTVLPWEFGKYSTAAIFGLAMVRSRTNRIPSLALFYFLLLIPSTLQLIPLTDLRAMLNDLSFNLSGALALMVCAGLCSNLTVRAEQFEKLMVALIAPVTAIATLAARSILVSSYRSWGASASNFLASAGYGPNQVSAALGLGLVAVWLLLVYGRYRGLAVLSLMALGLWFLAQALLTFSRGGAANALVAAGAGLFHALLHPKLRERAIALLLVGFLASSMLLIPKLETLTADALGIRFRSTSLTGREELAQAEIQVFREHPLMGVGPGQTDQYLASAVGHRSATHTEYTRLLAEHGLLGLAAIILLLVMVWRNYQKAGDDLAARGVIATSLVWGLAFMAHSAMRLAAPSLLIGLTAAEFSLGRKQHRPAGKATRGLYLNRRAAHPNRLQPS